MIARPGCNRTMLICYHHLLLLQRIIDGGVRGGKPTVVRALSAFDPVAQYFGLSPEQLIRLLDIILQGKIGMVCVFTLDTQAVPAAGIGSLLWTLLDDTTTRKLIKLLLPRQHVPEMCAVKILGCLGKQLSFSNQVR